MLLEIGPQGSTSFPSQLTYPRIALEEVVKMNGRIQVEGQARPIHSHGQEMHLIVGRQGIG